MENIVNYIVYDENWKKRKVCKTLEAARAYRSDRYGYAGYILAIDEAGSEVANYS